MTAPNNTTLPQGPYTYNSGITGTNPFITAYFLRDPTTSDINYPIQKRWINFTTTPPKEWILESLPGANNITTAQWKLLNGPGSGQVIDFIVPNGSSPVFPDGSGNVTLTSTSGTVVITGSTNTINFDITGGSAAVERLETDDSLFETPTGSPGTITIHGAANITTSQGTAHQVNIAVSGTTNHSVQIGNASGSLSSVTNGTTGQVLTAVTGSDPIWTAITAEGAVTEITGDDGVAVLPSTGNIGLIGTVVTNATHAKAVFTHSPSAHNESVDVQVSAAIASTDVTKVGLAAFNSAQFTVDANGFVSTIGSSTPSIKSVAIQTFTSTGTYTPTSGMLYCKIEVIGGGGGGGGTPACGAAQSAGGGGGGGGEYAYGIFSAATIGGSQAVTIGAAGAAGANTGTAGGVGGTTSVGSLITAIGGGAGSGSAAQGGPSFNSPGSGGTGGTGGSFRIPGASGTPSVFYQGQALVFGGQGAAGIYGMGSTNIASNGAGSAGVGYGGGGGGASTTNNNGGNAGGAGSKGIVIITEFID